MAILSFKDLVVWQKSMCLVTEIYKLTKLLPDEERYALSSQMRRAVVSIPSNIAEGQQRNTSREFVHFLCVARGSIAELETQLLICVNLNFFDEKQIETSMKTCEEIHKMLHSLIDKISSEQ
ncbi:MAG: four helix bundle protein [Eubacterium sp.]|nr:four helix bundle protein [Eubacterium sp.]